MKNINEVTTKSFNQVFLITGDRREKRIESEERKQRKRFLKLKQNSLPDYFWITSLLWQTVLKKTKQNENEVSKKSLLIWTKMKSQKTKLNSEVSKKSLLIWTKMKSQKTMIDAEKNSGEDYDTIDAEKRSNFTRCKTCC